MDILKIVKRHLLFVIILIILLGGAGFLYGENNQKNLAKTTIFLTIGTQDSRDPEQAEIASTYFGETIMGWFKNPVFIHSIKNSAKTEQDVSLSALKQERQNLLVEIIASTPEETKNISTHTLKKLQEEIVRYNKATGSAFVAIDQGKNTKINKITKIIYPLAGALLGLILGLFIIALKELLKDEISSTEEAEQILKIKTTDFLDNDWENNDLSLLSVAIQKASSIVILAGVGVETDILAVALAHKHSFFGEKIALVDGDLQNRSLHSTLGLSTRMKNIKGHTDASFEKNEINTMLIIQNTLDENLKFLPAGKGERFLTKVFSSLAQKMKTLIHTRLPENSEILRLNNATLVLVVKVGRTKRKDLKRIREVWNEDLKLVVVE